MKEAIFQKERCYKSSDFGKAVKVEPQTFSDLINFLAT